MAGVGHCQEVWRKVRIFFCSMVYQQVESAVFFTLKPYFRIKREVVLPFLTGIIRKQTVNKPCETIELWTVFNRAILYPYIRELGINRFQLGTVANIQSVKVGCNANALDILSYYFNDAQFAAPFEIKRTDKLADSSTLAS